MKYTPRLDEGRIARFKESGWWNNSTLLDAFDAAVAARPNATAVVAPDGSRLTYAELDVHSRRAAGCMAALGLREGDVVSVQLPNWSEAAVVHLAISRVGAVTNPLLPMYRENELSYILRFARTKMAVIPGTYRGFEHPAMFAGLRSALPDLQQVFVVKGQPLAGMRAYTDLVADDGASAVVGDGSRDGDDISALCFTSGTESNPKGVMHSHNTMMYATRTMAELFGLTHGDVIWTPSPVGHGTGFLWGMRLSLTIGGKLVLQDAWDPEEALRIIERERCSFVLSATPFVKMLTEAPSAGVRDTASLRIFGCAGAPIPRHLGPLARQKLGCELVGMWGMTECFVGSSSAPGDSEEQMWATDGRAMPGAELAIFDETRTRMLPPGETGELATRGPHVALGYFNDPERTANTFSKEGWLFTNDLGTLDGQGFLRIAGRQKDIINRGGLKVSAREVEDHLLQHPLVRDAAVVAVPDDRLGEKACAFIVARSTTVPELPDLIRFLEDRGLAKYKLPEYLEILPSLPMTASGKVQKFVLREVFSGANPKL